MHLFDTPTASESALYRRVWRWHFYAGLICMPFLVLLALTGALYLFKDPIESLVYAQLRFVSSSPAVALDAESLIAKAVEAHPGQPVRFNASPSAGRSVEVGIRTAHSTVGVYLDPSGGRVLGELPDDKRLMEVVKRLHSLEIVGKVANYWVEIVAGWAIVLVLSGTFLWWPRGGRGGPYSVRGRPGQRTWWRDLHAVTGVTAAAAILFLAVTGMPWSAYWGHHFGRLTSELGIGLPRYLFGPGPASSSPLTVPGGNVPWLISQAPVPQSTPLHTGHFGREERKQVPAAANLVAADAPSIGVNQARQIMESLGLPSGTPLLLPDGPRGTYAAILFPRDVRGQRVVHLDRYTGAVLSDVGYLQYGLAGRAIEWGINIHTGLQFGWVNQLVMLLACLSIITLASSAAVMWWKRRPRGRLAAPQRRSGDGMALGATVTAVVLGLIYPLLGASMLTALLLDTLVPQRWHDRLTL